ncbi:sugar kinase [Pseudoxanthomonas composti]|uniref:Sugar kinase n=1 Tax=Pseudoxanthomonas composti TaxID=2137479 RepID=A0A4Q1JVM2_9GAMM|nr:sugar kinase [Pseudoxanthomonas composti]RXR06318.1 sugar kinase [Pseudoxanthomonas composti]
MPQAFRFVCFGEVLLRLGAPGRQPLLQSPMLEAHVGGAEANVAVSLARFGHHAALVSRVPDNPLGEAALGQLRRHGVDTTAVDCGEGRMGLYFLTTGAMQRPSQVVYDRAGSAFANTPPAAFDWPRLLEGAAWLHLSGITPALGADSAAAARDAARQARQQGVRVSFDGNYRPQLWQRWQGDAAGVLRELFSLADILFVDHRDLAVVLGQQVPPHQDAFEHAQATAALAFSSFPHLQWVACTHRQARASDHHLLSASICTRQEATFAPAMELSGVVDRIGGGDAFAAGILHGLTQAWPLPQVARFGLAAGCLKHSWPGDFSHSSEADVERLVQGASMDVSR